VWFVLRCKENKRLLASNVPPGTPRTTADLQQAQLFQLTLTIDTITRANPLGGIDVFTTGGVTLDVKDPIPNLPGEWEIVLVDLRLA